LTDARPRFRAGSDPIRRPRYSFAVVADTHLNPVDDVSTSPWQTNAQANARSRAIVAELNAADVAFVVHLGDMIHPIPSHPDYPVAAQRFHTIFGDLDPPLHVVAGNHDVGDKPIAWTPAPTIDDEFLARYREHFGADHYTFDHDDATFIVVDAQLFNAPMGEADRHEEWLASALKAARTRHRRVFVFLHYPPYLHNPSELSHYDNLDEPGRSRLLELVAGHAVEAVFAGHVHNFFYDHYRGVEMYVAPSTAFIRHDYAELFRIAPGDDEHGRGDADKLGYLIVDVYDDGHVVHHRRTGNLRSSVDEAPDLVPVVRTNPAATAMAPPLVLDLRHRWAEEAEIPHTGGVDEMGRKLVRNDYVIQALWETGLWNLRVPAADLSTPVAAKRIADLGRMGLRFSVFCWYADAPSLLETMHGLRDYVDDVELIAPLDAGVMGELERVITQLRSVHDGTVTMSPLAQADHAVRDDSSDPAASPTVHAIRHGVMGTGLGAGASSAVAVLARIVDRVTFRAGGDDDVWQAVKDAERIADDWRIAATVHVQAGNDVPSAPRDNEDEVAARALAALVAAHAHRRTRVVFDTFLDHDRGYFPRVGLFDRRFNPRVGARAVANLAAILAAFDVVLRDSDADADADQWTAGPGAMTAGHAHVTTFTCDGSVPMLVAVRGHDAPHRWRFRGHARERLQAAISAVAPTSAPKTQPAASSEGTDRRWAVGSGPTTGTVVNLANGHVAEVLWRLVDADEASVSVEIVESGGSADGAALEQGSCTEGAFVFLPTVDLADWKDQDLVIDRWIAASSHR
ncbi:MAG: metallophosphoesterase, partial [Nitriliruptoraceae bacterium]